MSEDLLLLSQSTTLTNLTTLNLRGCPIVTSRAAPPPQKGDGFSKFGHFEFVDPTYVQPKPVNDFSGLVALLSSPVVKNLPRIQTDDTDLHDPLVLLAIATSPYLSNLTSLDLSDPDGIDAKVVEALATSTTLSNITHLSLAGDHWDDALITKVFAPPSVLANKLKTIHINCPNITASSLPVLNSPHLRDLTLLGNDKLGPAGAKFIAAHMPNLTKLRLSWCDIGDEGYTALAASTTLTNLHDLDLKRNQAEETQSIVALVNSPGMASLTHLNLFQTHFGPEVLVAIAKSPATSKLQHLNIGGNLVGDEAVLALAQSTTLTNLTRLDLRINDIGSDGINALCTSPVVSKVAFLQLDFNEEIGNSLAEALSAPSSTMHSLAELEVRKIGMDDEGCDMLWDMPNATGDPNSTYGGPAMDLCGPSKFWFVPKTAADLPL